MNAKIFFLLVLFVGVSLAAPFGGRFYSGGWGQPSFQRVSYSRPVQVAFRPSRPVFAAPSFYGGGFGRGYYDGDDDHDFDFFD